MFPPLFVLRGDRLRQMTVLDQCPRCGREPVVEIVYGLPGPELVAAALRGEVRIGGCCISQESPTHACRSCDHEWARGRPKL